MAIWRNALASAVVALVCIPRPATSAETYTSRTIYDEQRAVSNVAFSQDGARIVLVGEDKVARIRDVPSGNQVAEFSLGDRPMAFGSFNGDGSRLLFLGTDNSFSLWDVVTGHEISTWNPEQSVWSARFSADGLRAVVGYGDGSVGIREVETGSDAMVLTGHSAAVLDVAFSTDGALVVSASGDKTARLWEARDGKQRAVMRHGDKVNAIAISADGKRVLTGSTDHVARIFDAATGNEILALKEEGDVLAVAFSPDGSRAVTGNDDRSVGVWDTSTGERVARLDGHLAEVVSIGFTPDGQAIVSTARDGTGRVWTRAETVSPPQGTAGVWAQNVTAPDKMPDDIARLICLTFPVSVQSDGLLVYFQGTDTEPPQAYQHMRCVADSSCAIYPGAPAQGLEPIGMGSVKFTGDSAEFCVVGGECSLMARCTPPVWTDAERQAGVADVWDTQVLAPTR